MLLKTCVCRPEIGPKHFDKLKHEPDPNTVRPEKPGMTYNSALVYEMRFIEFFIFLSTVRRETPR